MSKLAFILVTRIVAVTTALIFLGYLTFVNTLPFGAVEHYTQTDKSVSALSPVSRIEVVTLDGVEVTKQKDNLIYFTTKFPFRFETARVKVTFRNPNPQQQIELGYKDKPVWHYDTKILDTALFYHPELRPVGTGPVLYQRSLDFYSVESFLENPPKSSVIGTFDFSLIETEPLTLPNYMPSSVLTVIDTPLRGSHVMYAYLENEPFVMTIKKQDLNWYEDPDVMIARVYKEGDLVFTATIDDDGITDASRNAGQVEEVTIRNPGPGLPEAGVYKIVFDASGDTVIRSIETNLHKIVFAGPLYLANNAEVYPSVVSNTATTTLYTESLRIGVTTDHNATLQTFSISNTSHALLEPHVEVVSTSTATTSVITLPKSDVMVSGVGHFAFRADELFSPNRLNVLPISSAEDLETVDYVLTPYVPPKTGVDGYSIVERMFDVTEAQPDKGRLSWIIRTPGLKESGGEVIVKSIEVTYIKGGWWKTQ